MSDFMKAIESAINRACKENDSNTPDFILANYLCNCLDAFTLATKTRDKWYSVHPEPCNSYFIKEEEKDSQPKLVELQTTNLQSDIDVTKCDVRIAEFIAWMKINYGVEQLWRNHVNLPPSDFIWQGWNAALDNIEAKKKQ